MSVESSVVSVPGPHFLQVERVMSDREGEVFRYLKQAKYPGVPEEVINWLISYCRGSGLDPLVDPAHIISYNERDKVTQQWRKSYKIVPGIAKFRTHASRTGRCMGISEPEFGPMIKEKIGSIIMEYPEWCIVKVKMLVDGKIAEYVAKEYWKENYASKKKDDPTPNDMWQKRPRGQLAKCTEAQGWRKACPELCGGLVTFEEMQGKCLQQDDEQEQLTERPSNVVDRLKSKRNVVEKVEMGSLGVVEVVELSGDEASDSEIEKPVKEVDPVLLGLFNMMKDSKKAISERVNEFMVKQGFSMGDLSNENLRTLIKKIASTFPEIKLQLSQDQRGIVENIEREEKK